jgi:phosphoheptose isomerase
MMYAGNGGSAADCQHMAGEFVSRFMFDRNPLPAVALTTDTSILIANDYGYEQAFSRQVQMSAELYKKTMASTRSIHYGQATLLPPN